MPASPRCTHVLEYRLDITVLITRETIYRQFAWSVGYCPYCEQLEAIRVEEVQIQTSLFLIPVHWEVLGESARCDFCGRAIDPSVIAIDQIAQDEWHPAEGIDVLMDNYTLPEDSDLPEVNSKRRLNSLLSAAQEASSISNLDVTFGATTGPLLGAPICLALGYLLHSSKLIRGDLEQMLLVSILVGVIGGMPFGALVHALIKRSKVAHRRINIARENYGIDIDLLEDLSQEYNRLVKRTVVALRDT